MNKQDIIEVIAIQNEITKKQAGEIFDSVFDAIFDGIISGDTVRIHGIGAFSTKEIAERQCMNFATGDKMTVAAHKAPKFKFSSVLKDAVKEA